MLKPKQEAFCLHYAKSGNATESYKKAGYKCKTERAVQNAASRLLGSVGVQERLRELAEEVRTPKIMEIEEMQARLSEFARMEAIEEIATPKGTIVKKKNGAADAIKAITQLAKMQGVAENVNVNISIPVIAGDDQLED
jgi:phage terminase small subunit